MDQMTVARYNRAKALTHLRRSAPLSRTELASRLGLTQTALTRIASEFRALDIVTEEPVLSLRPDQPRALLRINPDWGCAVTVSLVYNLSVGVVDLAGNLEQSERLAGNNGEFRHGKYRDQFDSLVTDAVARTLERCKDRNVLGVGVLSAGYVSPDGIILNSDDLPRAPLDMREMLSSVTDLPICVDEEYRLLLQSQLWQGEEREEQVVVALCPGLLGSGGGHALSIHGLVFCGRDGMAGLPGTLMGAPYYDPPGVGGKLSNGDVEAIGDVPTYLDAVAGQDPAAMAVFHKVIANYGYRLGQVVNYLNPHAVLLYTPYARLGEPFLQQVLQAAQPHAEPHALKDLELTFGGQRTDEERLRAAAVPVLSRIYVEGLLPSANESGKKGRQTETT